MSPSGVLPCTSPHEIVYFCRRYLNFKDLCATRRVCKSWSILSAIPIEYTVFIAEDGSFADLPNREHYQFRKCLLEADLRDVDIEISNMDHLNFLRHLIPSLRRLSIEIDIPFHFPSEAWSTWTRRLFPRVSNIQKLDLQVYGIDTPIEIDFSKLPRLSHFRSNCQVQLLNFDDRPMLFFGYVVDYWSDLCTVIALHSHKLRVCKYDGTTDEWESFFLCHWKSSSPRQNKPLYLECTTSGTHFCTYIRENLTCVLYPAMNLDQFQNVYEGSFEDYANLFLRILNENPSQSFLFHDSCTEHEKIWWRQIINPIRLGLGLDPFSSE